LNLKGFEIGLKLDLKRKEKKRKTTNPTQLPPRPTTTLGPTAHPAASLPLSL
jgi:hypothetical protein